MNNVVYDFLNTNIINVPNKISVYKNNYGYGLFSNINIKKGEVLYKSIFYNISNDDTIYTLHLERCVF
jgi:mannitol-specific phosphotransferase system IIBC component